MSPRKRAWIAVLLVLAAAGAAAVAARFLWPQRYWTARHQFHKWRIDILGRRETPKPKFVFNTGPTRDILFCIADHFEPDWGAANAERLAPFLEGFRSLALEFQDADGCPPKITWFVKEGVGESPGDATLGLLAPLVRQGLGEVEVHIHLRERYDSEQRAIEDFVSLVQKKMDAYQPYGFCHYASESGEARVRFGFVQGDWALDNSRLEETGQRIRCGINTQLRLLSEVGCYADFTFPAWGSMAPTLIVDRPYYAKDDPDPKSYDKKENVQVMAAGQSPFGDLLLLQGPNCNEAWNRSSPLSLERMKEWLAHEVEVEGRPDWLLVKIHSHSMIDLYDPQTGALDPAAADAYFGDSAKAFFADLLRVFNDGKAYRLHFVSARELFNVAKAAEAGFAGNPKDFRDFALPKPLCFSPLPEANEAARR